MFGSPRAQMLVDVDRPRGGCAARRPGPARRAVSHRRPRRPGPRRCASPSLPSTPRPPSWPCSWRTAGHERDACSTCTACRRRRSPGPARARVAARRSSRPSRSAHLTQRCGYLAADPAAADDGADVARLSAAARMPVGVGGGAQVVHADRGPRRHVEPARLRARGQDQRAVVERAAVVDVVTRCAARSMAVAVIARQQLDVRRGVLGCWPDVSLVERPSPRR